MTSRRRSWTEDRLFDFFTDQLDLSQKEMSERYQINQRNVRWVNSRYRDGIAHRKAMEALGLSLKSYDMLLKVARVERAMEQQTTERSLTDAQVFAVLDARIANPEATLDEMESLTGVSRSVIYHLVMHDHYPEVVDAYCESNGISRFDIPAFTRKPRRNNPELVRLVHDRYRVLGTFLAVSRETGIERTMVRNILRLEHKTHLPTMLEILKEEDMDPEEWLSYIDRRRDRQHGNRLKALRPAVNDDVVPILY